MSLKSANDKEAPRWTIYEYSDYQMQIIWITSQNSQYEIVLRSMHLNTITSKLQKKVITDAISTQEAEIWTTYFE